MSPELSKIVHKAFFKEFKKTTDKTKAEIILVGINSVDTAVYPKSQYIICNCTNINHIENYNKIPIISLKDKGRFLNHITSTAEHTILLMLSLARNGALKWDKFERPTKPYHTLKDKCLGIIGYGRIGKQVAKIAESLGMVVYKNDTDLPVKSDTLVEILECDYISIHASIGPKSRPIIGKTELQYIKDGAYLINTSRGEAIDEKELVKNIDRLGGFAADTICCGPGSPIFASLVARSNVILTPHIGGYTIEDLTKSSEFCFKQLMERI